MSRIGMSDIAACICGRFCRYVEVHLDWPRMSVSIDSRVGWRHHGLHRMTSSLSGGMAADASAGATGVGRVGLPLFGSTQGGGFGEAEPLGLPGSRLRRPAGQCSVPPPLFIFPTESMGEPNPKTNGARVRPTRARAESSSTVPTGRNSSLSWSSVASVPFRQQAP